MIKFNNDVLHVLKSLTSNGYEAYIVGGAVRNYLLGIEADDYDITTNATPEQILEVFSYTKAIPTGMNFGTITVFYKHQKYEITTYRVDGKYNDNRHPESVFFSKSLKDDLGRRDFTINALAYNNQLIDYYNGLVDLKNKILRCIGDPHERFEEDAIRILRAIRFSSKLKFKIDPLTKQAIYEKKELLNNIAIERINSELFEIFKYAMIDIYNDFFDIFTQIFSHINVRYKENILNKIEKLINNNCSTKLIYSAFFMFLSNNELESVVKKFKLSNEQKYIIKLLNIEKIELSQNIIDYRKLLKKMSKNDIILYIDYNVFDIIEKQEKLKILEDASLLCNDLKSLHINGNDLIKIGIFEKNVGEILNHLLDKVINEEIHNNKEELILYVLNSLSI